MGILATDGFEQAELPSASSPFAERRRQGPSVVSPKGGVIQGYQHGEKGDFVKVDMLLADARPEMFDALQLPGGVVNSDKLRLEPAAGELVGALSPMRTSRLPPSATGSGRWPTLTFSWAASVTSWPSLKTDSTNAGAQWEDQPVVDDVQPPS